MGEVWLAEDALLQRPVALKFLPEVLAQDPAALAHLKVEALRALQLTHRHIVRVYDLVSDQRWAAISMEFLPGGSLAADLAARNRQSCGCYTQEELYHWIVQVGDALAYAHEEKIIHRDIKPANLLLDSQRNLKVADFGIAAHLSHSLARVSRQPLLAGSPSYMSPQQWRGEPPAIADDIYSLGATLYELIAGQPPFVAGELAHQVLHSSPRPLESFAAAKAYPNQWRRTIHACLSKEPMQRPACVADLLDALSSAPRKLQSTARGGRPDRKWRTTAAGFVAAAVLLLVLSLVHRVADPKDSKEVPAVPSQPSKVSNIGSPAIEGENLQAMPSADPRLRVVHKPRPSLDPSTIGVPWPDGGPRPGLSWRVDLDKLPPGALALEFLPLSGAIVSPEELVRADPNRDVDHWVARYPVTQAQWQALMETSVSAQRDLADRQLPLRGRGNDHPIYFVTWLEAMEFARRLTRLEAFRNRLPPGYVYSLPPESVWVSAGRFLTDHSNSDFDSRFIPREDLTYPVVSKSGQAPIDNEPGVNILEWMLNPYIPSWAVQHSAPGSSSATLARVVRGRSWSLSDSFTKKYPQIPVPPQSRFANLGFRLALIPEPAR